MHGIAPPDNYFQIRGEFFRSNYDGQPYVSTWQGYSTQLFHQTLVQVEVSCRYGQYLQSVGFTESQLPSTVGVDLLQTIEGLKCTTEVPQWEKEFCLQMTTPAPCPEVSGHFFLMGCPGDGTHAAPIMAGSASLVEP